MKTQIKILALALIGGFIATSCQKVSQKIEYTANIPLYMSYDDLRRGIHNENDATLERPGKIFLYNSLILINDFEKGVHIYDNSNPSNPTHIAFINIPGNVDIAVKDNILYVDSYVDIVALDISDPTQAREVDRVKDALSYTIPTTMDFQYPVAQIDPTKGVVIGYSVGDVVESCKNEDCKRYYNHTMDENWNGSWDGQMMTEDGVPVSFSGTSNNVRSSATSNNSAIAGSMARFMMIGQYLYAISSERSVEIFDVSTNNMQNIHTFQPWQDAGGNGRIETLYTLNDHLFIGSNTGMLTYNIENPASPEYLAVQEHVVAIDPVVANEDYAFITLRSDMTTDALGVNRVEIFDIRDIENRINVCTFDMHNPHGLDIDNEDKLLFVCDGSDGLKIFDFTDIASTGQNQLQHLSGYDTYDVILNNGIAHVIGDNGLLQLRYDKSGTLNELSRIPLN